MSPWVSSFYTIDVLATLLCINFFLVSVQCDMYKQDLVSGSLCEKMCKTKEIKFKKCHAAHRLKRLVLEAEWKGHPIILKSIRPYQQHRQRVQHLHNSRPMGYKLYIPANINKTMNLTRSSSSKPTQLYFMA